MKLSEFEKLLKDKLPSESYLPKEENWEKLSDDFLQNNKRRSLVFYWTAAASVFAVILLSILQFSRNNTIDNTKQSIVKTSPKQPITQKNNSVYTEDTISYQQMNSTLERVEKIALEKKSSDKVIIEDSLYINQLQLQNDTAKSLAEVMKQNKKSTQLDFVRDDSPSSFLQKNEDANHSSILLAVGAQYGVSQISNSQFNISLQARRNISSKLYAEVALSGGYNQIKYSEAHYFQSTQLGSNINEPPITTTQNIEAVYSSNVYSVGLMPAVGYLVTERISVILGGDANKILSSEIKLNNSEEFQNHINQATIIPENQQLPSIDIGVISRVKYSFGKRISVGLQYRKGLSPYFKTNGNAMYNSGLSIGALFNFR